MKKHLILLFAAVPSLLTACDTAAPAPDNLVMVSYAQTSCADPWAGTGQHTTAGFQSAVERYFQPKNVAFYRVQVSASTGAACLACHCKTGQVLRAEVEKDDLEVLLAAGFQLQ